MNSPFLIVPIDHRVELLPYHIVYYSRLGFKRFVYAVWNGESNPIVSSIAVVWSKTANKDCTMVIRPSVICDYDHYNGPAETPGLNKIREEFVGPDDWYCVADLDEFYHFGVPTIQEVIQRLEREEFLAVQGRFYDRVACDGSFPPIPYYEANPTQLDDLFPCVADLQKVTQCGDAKISLTRRTEICSGHHLVEVSPYNILRDAMQVHHFKWHQGVLELLLRRHKSYGSQKLAWAHESRTFYDFLQKPNWIKDPI